MPLESLKKTHVMFSSFLRATDGIENFKQTHEYVHKCELHRTNCDTITPNTFERFFYNCTPVKEILYMVSNAFVGYRCKVMEQKIKIRDLNEFIICSICSGYLINASTVTECLHTFCRSCIVKHLEENTHCPKCEKVIHHSHPMNYLRLDRTMQDVVYKLVPGLQNKEKKREEKFKRKNNPITKTKGDITFKDSRHNSSPNKSCKRKLKEETDYHRNDEQVFICLECQRLPENKRSIQPLKRKYLRLSSQATVQILRKYVAKKLRLKSHTDIDIFCNEELLGKDHTLKFIVLTRWKFKKGPLMLHYRSSLQLI